MEPSFSESQYIRIPNIRDLNISTIPSSNRIHEIHNDPSGSAIPVDESQSASVFVFGKVDVKVVVDWSVTSEPTGEGAGSVVPRVGASFVREPDDEFRVFERLFLPRDEPRPEVSPCTVFITFELQ